MEKTLESLNKTASTNGVIIGIISSVITIVTYYVGPRLMGSVSYGIGLGVLSLVLYIIFTIDLRRKIGGHWEFREALKGIFLMAFVAGILNMAINFIFYKFIEPGAYEKVSGYIADSLAQNYEKMGMDQEASDKMVAISLTKLKSQLDPGPMDLLKNLSIAILVQFILSVIFATIFKKSRPVFVQAAEE
jgi:hypothetical protein